MIYGSRASRGDDWTFNLFGTQKNGHDNKVVQLTGCLYHWQGSLKSIYFLKGSNLLSCSQVSVEIVLISLLVCSFAQEYQQIVDAEWDILYDKLDKIVKSGAKVVLSKLPIGDVATQYFADR